MTALPYMPPMEHRLFLIIRERPGLSTLELLVALYGDNSRHLNTISVHVNGINKVISRVNRRIIFREGGYYLEELGGSNAVEGRAQGTIRAG